MSTETINLIIGSAIAIISAFITSSINFRFQLIKEEKNRSWKFKDSKNEFLLSRANLIEGELTKCVCWVEKVNNYYIELLENQNSTDKITTYDQLPVTDHLIAINKIFNNPFLENAISETLNWTWEVYGKIKTESEGQEPNDILDLISTPTLNTYRFYKQAVLELDNIRINLLKENT